MLDNAYLSMASFMGLQSTDFNAEQNIFSAAHKEPVRIVYSRNYDKELNTSVNGVTPSDANIRSPITVKKDIKLLQ